MIFYQAADGRAQAGGGRSPELVPVVDACLPYLRLCLDADAGDMEKGMVKHDGAVAVCYKIKKGSSFICRDNFFFAAEWLGKLA
jgi:hypothetical protein